MTPLLAAKLCDLVYDAGDAVLYAAPSFGIRDAKFLDIGGTQVLLGIQNDDGEEDETVVVFRGTKIDPIDITWSDVLRLQVKWKILASMKDVKYDLLARRVPWCGKGSVHRGFKAALSHVSLDIHNYIGNRRSETVQVMGHSLGGALAHIYAGLLAGELADLTRVNVTTFGSPYVGDAEACRHIDDNCYRIKNYVFCSDIVPRLLSYVPGYHLPGDVEYVNRKGVILYRATRLRKFIDRSILRLMRARGGIVAAFRQEIEHHSIEDWIERECLAEAA